MAKWCINALQVRGSKEDVAKFRKQAKGFPPGPSPGPGELPDAFNFHSLIPVPVGDLGYEYLDDWEKENWGCIWGAYDSQIMKESDRCLLYNFKTPVSPPLKLIAQVSKDWPTLIFELGYAQRGKGYTGMAKADAGRLEDHRS